MQPEVAMKTETYEVQIGKLLEQLTLEEKIGMIHGAGLFRTEGVEHKLRHNTAALFLGRSDGRACGICGQ
jgi:hypothetical protein